MHNNLVIKASHKKVLSTAASDQSNRKVHPACDADIFNALQLKSESLHSRPQQTSDLPTVLAETNTLDDAIIVKGTKEKKRILDAYKERFGHFNHSIVSKKKIISGADSQLFLPDSARATLLIWDIVLTEKSPTHQEVQILKRKLLGSLIILNG